MSAKGGLKLFLPGPREPFDLHKKTLEAIDRISIALDRSIKPVVGCSFGKDSLVVLHLVRQLKPEVTVIWNNTLVEYPETIHYARKLTADWNLNLVVAKPERPWTFWEVVERWGWPCRPRGAPVVRGSSARQDKIPADRCCEHLKKYPMKRAIKEHGWDLSIDGLTAYESQGRLILLRKVGFYRQSKDWGCMKLSPIWDWTPNAVWDYIEQHELPYNPIYDMEIADDPRFTRRGMNEGIFCRSLRVGCWCCTLQLYFGGLKHLRQFHPKLWEFLMIKRGLGAWILKQKLGDQMTLFEDPNNVKGWMKARPCYFDSV